MTGRTNVSTREKINNAQDIEVVAADQIRIGDTVYVVDNGPKNIYTDRDLTFLDRSVLTSSFSPDGKTLVLGGNFTGKAKAYSVSGTTITYVRDIYADSGTAALNSTVYTASFSHDGKTLILGGNFSGYAKVYSVSGTTITYVRDIYADAGTTALDSTVQTIAFSPDGKTLVLGGYFTGYAKVYSVSGTTITYVRDIYADNSATILNGSVGNFAFSPDGKILVLGGDFTGKAKFYTVSGTTITYVKDIYANAGITALNNFVFASSFSPDGKTLILGGWFTGYAKVYSVSGTTITYVRNIYADSGTTALSNIVYTSSFSPDGNTLILGGAFTGIAKAYSVSGTNITYVKDIYANIGTTALDGEVDHVGFSPDGKFIILGGGFTGKAKAYSMQPNSNLVDVGYEGDIYADSGTTAFSSSVLTSSFSPDGKTLVLGGYFTGYAKVYSVSGTTITYVKDIYADAGTKALGGYVPVAAFSPDGKTLILGGSFTGYAKVYSVSGTTITYVKDIYADAGAGTLGNVVKTVSFSPDGKTLVLGGEFMGFAKVYSVSGTTITYVKDIYADSGITPLDYNVNTTSFSPDGKTLILGGEFMGSAKVYSVSGTTITYVKDIYADSGTTAFSSSVYTSPFSPDGKTLILGGNFSGYAKVYSVSGTTITYVRDIYADAGTTALNNFVFASSFSPDGKTLVLGGYFTGYAKVYSVSGTTITYVKDIYADNGTTALSSYASTSSFSPDGKTLVLGGYFTGYTKVYRYSIPVVPENRILAYSAQECILNLDQIENQLIGFSKSAMAPGTSGRVRTIAKLQTDSWAGSLSFSGTFANPTYFTESGCSLNVDKESGRAFLTIQGGTSTAYENVVFYLVSAPYGVELLTPQSYTYASNPVGNYYTCVLTGIDRRINMFVDLDQVNSSYDNVRAAITVT